MIMKNCISLFIVASCLLFAGIALAGDTVSSQGRMAKSSKPHMKFEDCDRGNAGALTFEEAQACWPKMSKKRFNAIDADKDGKITKKEIKAHRAAKKQARENRKRTM